uniref:NADH-ubiquinone oxidoreductase chain 3 n=1 Tax=Cephalonomia gallicola TaxID=627714 RepID=E0WCE8_9HYME|nr:NADH dehydrogenase subunit 3 [Cephalonomia gallicola]
MMLTLIMMLFLQINNWWTFNSIINRNTNSPFECGFKNFSQKFYTNSNLKFINIALIYLIFDIEISLFTPILFQFNSMNYIMSTNWMISMMIFIMFLFSFTVYEFLKGNFKW